LLDIFLAKVRVCGLHRQRIRDTRRGCEGIFTYFYDIKELGYDSSDTSEKCWSDGALHLMAISFDFNKRPFLSGSILADSRRIHLPYRR